MLRIVAFGSPDSLGLRVSRSSDVKVLRCLGLQVSWFSGSKVIAGRVWLLCCLISHPKSYCQHRSTVENHKSQKQLKTHELHATSLPLTALYCVVLRVMSLSLSL